VPDEADRTLAEVGRQLADALERALPVWVERHVERLLVAFGGDADDDAMAAAADAGREAVADLGPRIRALVAADVDEQRVNPLTLVRHAVRYPTAVLRDAGVPPVVRDEFAELHFPDDDYDLTPMTWSDIDESLHEVGIVWGAAKARAHVRRHRGQS
jgi:hypothetical protein